MRDMSRTCAILCPTSEFASNINRGGSLGRYEQMMRENRRRQEQRERDSRIASELDRRDWQRETQANDRANRDREAENRRHRERMALERRRDRRDSLRRQGFTEGEIAEIERREHWRSIRNTIAAVIFVGAGGLGLIWAIDNFGAGALQQNNQYLRSADANENDDTGRSPLSSESDPEWSVDSYENSDEVGPTDAVEYSRSADSFGDHQATIDYEGVRSARQDRIAQEEADILLRIPFNSPKLLDKTEEALDTGKAAMWRAEGETGYVLVSEPRVTGDTECRQLSVSLINDGDQSVSPATEYCRENGGAWFAR